MSLPIKLRLTTKRLVKRRIQNSIELLSSHDYQTKFFMILSKYSLIVLLAKTKASSWMAILRVSMILAQFLWIKFLLLRKARKKVQKKNNNSRKS